jgi:hypothetical protein
MPTRVIDIGSDTDSMEVRLLETQGTRGRYVCLSHCWGNHRPLQTTTANVNSHLTCIEWSDIPSMYRDAIRFTRALGVRYLWIDSLCIIQDDSQDWVRESSAMIGVFSNSYLTIAATSVGDSRDGLWCRDKYEIRKLEGATSSGSTYDLSFRPVIRHLGIWNSKNWLRESMPLLDRAWVFQERLLSARVLHLSWPEMMWECKEKGFCECGDPDLVIIKRGHEDILSQASPEELAMHWCQLVEEYSALTVTFMSDKLPALSGLAQQMQMKRPESQYLAGLWKDTLETELLWLYMLGDYWEEMEDDINDSPIRQPSIAGRPTGEPPSWSWAYAEVKIIFPYSPSYYSQNDDKQAGEVLQQWAKILQAECTLATKDTTGEVANGSLVLEVELFDVVLVKDQFMYQLKNPKNSIPTEGFKGEVRVYCDYRKDPLGEGPQPTRNKWPINCAKMTLVRRVNTSSKEVYDIEYCMLLHMTTTSRNEFRRIGMACIEWKTALGKEDERQKWRERVGFFGEDDKKPRVITVI